MLIPMAAAIEPIRMSRLATWESSWPAPLGLPLVQDLQDPGHGDHGVVRVAPVANAFGCIMSEM